MVWNGPSSARRYRARSFRLLARVHGAVVILATLAILGFAAMLAPSARGAVEFYAKGGLGTFEMNEVNNRVQEGNRQCSEMQSALSAAGVAARCTPAAGLQTGLSGEVGIALAAGGLMGASIGYQYLTGATAWRLDASTDASSGSYSRAYAVTAQGPVVKLFMGMPGPLVSARLFAGLGQYRAVYREEGQLQGQVDDPDAVRFSETYTAEAPGYEVGLELRSPLGPQASLAASVAYAWLRMANTVDHEGRAGPELDFSGLRLQGGLSVAF